MSWVRHGSQRECIGTSAKHHDKTSAAGVTRPTGIRSRESAPFVTFILDVIFTFTYTAPYRHGASLTSHETSNAAPDSSKPCCR